MGEGPYFRGLRLSLHIDQKNETPEYSLKDLKVMINVNLCLLLVNRICM